MKVRRVVTGHNSEGKAVVASDEYVDGITVGLLPGAEFHRVWGGDEAPLFPDDGSPRPAAGYFPPLGGFRFGLFTVAPQSVRRRDDLDRPAAFAEIEAKLPGLVDTFERANPGMHTTNTIDFEYVLSGEIWLELDDGVAVHLRAGDTVVQNGTRHAWRNRGNQPCQLVLCIIGARRR